VTQGLCHELGVVAVAPVDGRFRHVGCQRHLFDRDAKVPLGLEEAERLANDRSIRAGAARPAGSGRDRWLPSAVFRFSGDRDRSRAPAIRPAAKRRNRARRARRGRAERAGSPGRLVSRRRHPPADSP
jgi:hypothetical protein